VVLNNSFLPLILWHAHSQRLTPGTAIDDGCSIFGKRKRGAKDDIIGASVDFGEEQPIASFSDSFGKAEAGV
jgi:hypothetical protein